MAAGKFSSLVHEKEGGAALVEILSVFDHSLFAEMILRSLMDSGIEKNHIIIFSLRQRPHETLSLDTLNHPDDTSLFDLGAIFATIFGVIGASIGFRLTWGPIIWGLIASAGGFLSGLAINYLFTNKQSRLLGNPSSNSPGVILIVQCRCDQQRTVEQLLWKNHTLGLTVIDG